MISSKRSKGFLKIVSIISFVLLVMGCDEREIYSLQPDQKVVFMVSSSNFAWGRNLSGFFVSRDGEIRRYRNPPVWNIPEKLEMTEEQMNENLTQTTIAKVKLDEDEVSRFIKKIPEIKSNSFSPRIQVGNDMGGTSYYILMRDAEQKKYELLLLEEKGDWEVHSTDKSAIEITQWLKGLYPKILGGQ